MDQELKAKWVEALRSGKYVQGRMQLYHKGSNSYCCLGVLGLLIGKTHDEMDNDSSTPEWDILPRDVIGHCVDMNDHRKRTFTEIADYIEKEA
jgi:hypothetical protein